MGSIPLSVLIPDPNEPLRMAQGLTGIQGQQQAIALNKALAPGQIQQQQQALQQGQQQLAGGAMENQQKQLALQDQQAMTKALQEWDGKDPNELPGLILRHGGSATAVFGAKNQLLQQQTALTKLQSDQLANQASINDVIAGHFEAIKGATDKESAYQTAVSDLEQKGLMKPGQAPPQYPGDAQLDLLEKNFIGQKALVEQEVKNREAANKKQELDIEQQKLTNTLPGGPLENPEQKYLRLQTAGKTGQPVSDTDKAFIQSYEKNKTMVPAFNINAGSNLLGNQPGGALDMAAENYFATGQLPAGARSPGMVSSIINRASQLHPNGTGDLAGNRAAYASNKSSYENVTKTLDTLSAFEQSGLKNLKQFTDLADKLPDTGVPWLNTPLRNLNKNIVGDQYMPAIEAARSVALREIARVTNDPKLSGALTDTARAEVEGFSPTNATLPQIKNVAKVLQQDMANVHGSLAQQKADIGARLGIKVASPQAGAQPAGAPAVATPPPGATHAVKDGSGKIIGYTSDGKTMIPVATQ